MTKSVKNAKNFAKSPQGYYKVSFLVLRTGEIVEKGFDSLYLCRRFVNKLRYSKRCQMISCPISLG